MSDAIVNAISDAADRYGVDPNLALNVAHQESGFDQSRVSPKGAVGVMQLMPSTAKGLGVDPNNIDQNINGGVRYLSQLSNRYKGDPYLTAAAYNAGPSAVDAHGGVPPYKETQDYVKSVVDNGRDFAGPQLPHSTQLDAAFGLPSGSGTTGAGATATPTSKPSATTALPPTADLDKAFGVNRGAAPTVQPQAKPQSPGFQKAYQTFKPPAAPPASAIGTAADQITNGMMSNALPVVAGTVAALGTGITNFINNHFNTGYKPAFSVSDAYSGARQANSDALNKNAQAHPIAAAIGNTGGFLGSPVLKGMNAVTGLARPAIAAAPRALAIGGRALIGATEAGAAGAASGAGQGASEGASPSQIGANALTYGVPSALGGAAGEVLAPVFTKGAAALVGHNAHPAAAVAARVGAHALLGGATGGAIGYGTSGGNMKAAELGAAMGAGFGSTGGIKEAPAITPGSYSPEAADIATEHLAKTISPNLDEAANTLAASSHSTTAEAAGEHAPALMQTATQANANSVDTLKGNIADRQEQSKVKTNLVSAVNKAVGGNIEPGSITNTVADDVANTTGIHPAEAETNVADYLDNKRKTVNANLWGKVDNTTPVNTEAHSNLLTNEPVVRSALTQAQRDLGPEGSTANPKFTPPENPKTAQNLTADDISDYFKNGPVAGRNFSQIDPQEIADHINSKATGDEPETVPTQKAWILAERYLGRSVPRNSFGKVDYSNPRTVEVQNSQQEVNAANKQHFEGLIEAKAASGEDFSFERNKDLGNNLNTTKTSESPEAFAKRYETLSSPDKEATQHGYLQEFYRKLRNDPIAASNEYSKDIHQNFQKTMFGEDGANAIQGALYKAKLAKAINNVNASGGTIEEKHLKELSNFTTDESERATQDKIFGKEKANQLREAITNQIEMAKSGSQITKFSSNSKAAEKDHDTVQAAALGFVSHGLHGALKGVGVTSALKSTGHVLEAIKQGRITPEVQQALADKLAQSPQQTSKDISDLKAKKESMPLSKSSIVQHITNHALKGAGYLAGRTITNAFSGVDTH